LPAALAVGVAYGLLRVAGRLAGGLLVRRAAGARAPRDLGLQLLPPGIFGVAFALNALTVAGADASVLLTAVVTGTIGGEFFSRVSPLRGQTG
jgi:hypothetical protein